MKKSKRLTLNKETLRPLGDVSGGTEGIGSWVVMCAQNTFYCPRSAAFTNCNGSCDLCSGASSPWVSCVNCIEYPN